MDGIVDQNLLLQMHEQRACRRRDEDGVVGQNLLLKMHEQRACRRREVDGIVGQNLLLQMHEQRACRRREVDSVVVQNIHDVVQRPEHRAVVRLLHKPLAQLVCKKKKERKK